MTDAENQADDELRDALTSSQQPSRDANVSLAAALADDLLQYGALIGRDGRRNNEDMPPTWPKSFLVDINNIKIAPALNGSTNLKWARSVHAVSPDADCAKDFYGDYLRQKTAVMPGEVILAVEENTGHVQVYIVLPTGDWAREARSPTLWRRGWAREIRAYVSALTALSRVQRVLRVCQEIVGRLRSHGMSPEAVQYYVDITANITVEPTTLTEDSILRAFDDWVFRTSAYVGADRNKILDVLAQALGLSHSPNQKDPFAAMKNVARYGRFYRNVVIDRNTK